jgi:hypothetical protein
MRYNINTVNKSHKPEQRCRKQFFDVGRPWVCQVGGAYLWVWLRMRALHNNIDHGWARFHLPSASASYSALASSIDIAACSTDFCLFLPVYHWSKCGLEDKKSGRSLRFLRNCKQAATVSQASPSHKGEGLACTCGAPAHYND